jgi:hypothetical protein
MKTRLQLQGELQRADSNAPKVYKNVLDVFQKTWRHEGIKGLQRGLLPAVRPSVPPTFCAAWSGVFRPGQLLLVPSERNHTRLDWLGVYSALCA